MRRRAGNGVSLHQASFSEKEVQDIVFADQCVRRKTSSTSDHENAHDGMHGGV